MICAKVSGSIIARDILDGCHVGDNASAFVGGFA
jgi:hypothetical protein